MTTFQSSRPFALGLFAFAFLQFDRWLNERHSTRFYVQNRTLKFSHQTSMFNGSLTKTHGPNCEVEGGRKGELLAEFERINRQMVGKRDSLDIQQDMICMLRLFYTRAKICLRKQNSQHGLKLRNLVKKFIIHLYFKSNEINLLMENPSYEELMSLYLAIYVDLLFQPSGKESVSQLCCQMISFIMMVLGHSIPHVVDVLLLLNHLSQHKIWDFMLPLLQNIVGVKSSKRTPELYMKTIILIRHWLKNCSRENRKEVKKLGRKIVAPAGVGHWLQSNELPDLATILKETSMPTTALLLSKTFLPEAYKKLHKELKLTTKYNHLLRKERIISKPKASDVFKVGAFFIDTSPDRTATAWKNEFGREPDDALADDGQEVMEIPVDPEPDANEVLRDALSNEISDIVGTTRDERSSDVTPNMKTSKRTSTPEIIENHFSSQSVMNDEVILFNGSDKERPKSPKKSPKKKEIEAITSPSADVTVRQDENELLHCTGNEMRMDDIVLKVNNETDPIITLADEKTNDELCTPLKTKEQTSLKKSTKMQTRSGSSVADSSKKRQTQVDGNARQTVVADHWDLTDAEKSKISNQMDGSIANSQNCKADGRLEPVGKLKRKNQLDFLIKDPISTPNSSKRFCLSQDVASNSHQYNYSDSDEFFNSPALSKRLTQSPHFLQNLKTHDRNLMKKYNWKRPTWATLENSDDDCISNASEEECVNVVLETSSTCVDSASDMSSLSESSSSGTLSEVQCCHDSVAKPLCSLNKKNEEIRKQNHGKLSDAHESYYDPNMSVPLTSYEFDEEIIIYRNDLNTSSLSSILDVVKEALDKREPLGIPKKHLESHSVISPSSVNKTLGLNFDEKQFQEGIKQKIPAASSSVADSNNLCSTPVNHSPEECISDVECVNGVSPQGNLTKISQTSSGFNNDKKKNFANVGSVVENFVKSMDGEKHFNVLQNDLELRFDLSSSPIIKLLPPVPNNRISNRGRPNSYVPLIPTRKKPSVLLQYPADYVLHKNKCLKEICQSVSTKHLKPTEQRSSKKRTASVECLTEVEETKNDHWVNRVHDKQTISNADLQKNLGSDQNEDFKIVSPKRTSSFGEDGGSCSAMKSLQQYKSSCEMDASCSNSDTESNRTFKISEDAHIKYLLKPVRVVLTRVSIAPKDIPKVLPVDVQHNTNQSRRKQKTNKHPLVEPSRFTELAPSSEAISRVEAKIDDKEETSILPDIEIVSEEGHESDLLSASRSSLSPDGADEAKSLVMNSLTSKECCVLLKKLSTQGLKGKQILENRWTNHNKQSPKRTSPRKKNSRSHITETHRISKPEDRKGNPRKLSLVMKQIPFPNMKAFYSNK